MCALVLLQFYRISFFCDFRSKCLNMQFLQAAVAPEEGLKMWKIRETRKGGKVNGCQIGFVDKRN
jgi:hypothetical protein